MGKQDLRLSELDGRPIVLNFWARFCGPCWTEMPELQEFYEEYSGELILLGIDVGQFTGLGSPKDAGRLLVLQRRFLHLVTFGQFLAGNRFAEGKTTKLSSAWAGRHEEVLKAPFLRTVVVILGSLGVTYPAGYTDDDSVVRDYRVRAMPTTIFISAEGKIFRTWTGSITREEVTAIVREMLAEG